MPIETPDGFTHIEQAIEKWGRSRNFWYAAVREGELVGYKIAGDRGTYLKDADVAEFLKPKPLMGEEGPRAERA